MAIQRDANFQDMGRAAETLRAVWQAYAQSIGYAGTINPNVLAATIPDPVHSDHVVRFCLVDRNAFARFSHDFGAGFVEYGIVNADGELEPHLVLTFKANGGVGASGDSLHDRPTAVRVHMAACKQLTKAVFVRPELTAVDLSF